MKVFVFQTNKSKNLKNYTLFCETQVSGNPSNLFVFDWLIDWFLLVSPLISLYLQILLKNITRENLKYNSNEVI